MNLIKGIFSPLQAITFILANPGLKRYLFLPFLCSSLFFVAMAVLWANLQEPIIEYIEPYLWSWLSSMVSFFSWLIFGVVSSLCFSMIGMILASPFNDLLCQKVLKIRGWPVIEENFLRSAYKAVMETSKLFALKMLLFIPSLLIPGLQLFLLLFFIGWDYFDYPWSYKAFGLRRKFTFLKQDSFSYLGFAGVYFLLFSIPFAGIFVMPIAVVSAALLAKAPSEFKIVGTQARSSSELHL